MRNLLIDLSGVDSLSSAGLRALLGISKMLDGGAGGGGKSAHLKLLSPQQQIRRVLNIAGFENLFDIFEDRDKALESF
jgi:anti-anti-sigma factor